MLGTNEHEVKTIAEQKRIQLYAVYPTLINWDKTENEKLTALIEVKVTPQRGLGFDKIAERIYKFDEVESVYLMSGGFDLTVIIDGKSMRRLQILFPQNLLRWNNIVNCDSFCSEKIQGTWNAAC